jgi:hypothetical protein
VLLVLAEVFDDLRRAFSGNGTAQFVYRRSPQVGDASVGLQEPLGSPWPNARDVQECAFGLAGSSTLAVEGDGKTVGFVANLLDQVQYGRMAVEHDRFVFLT